MALENISYTGFIHTRALSHIDTPPHRELSLREDTAFHRHRSACGQQPPSSRRGRASYFFSSDVLYLDSSRPRSVFVLSIPRPCFHALSPRVESGDSRGELREQTSRPVLVALRTNLLRSSESRSRRPQDCSSECASECRKALLARPAIDWIDHPLTGISASTAA